MTLLTDTIKLKVQQCAKAVVAVATPIVATAALSILTDLNTAFQTAIVAALTGGAVWAKKNAK